MDRGQACGRGYVIWNLQSYACQENCRDFGIMDGYVCDWENHREMRFTQFIDVRGEDIFEKYVYI